MRKSCRSLVNWGKREMKLIFMDFHNRDEKLFDCFRRFHKKVAGKVTRPISSWNIMFKLIKENKAILVLGYLEPELVATTYLCYNKQLFYTQQEHMIEIILLNQYHIGRFLQVW